MKKRLLVISMVLCFLALYSSVSIAETIGVKKLLPIEGSEVLDNVSVIILPNGKIEEFEITANQGESAGYSIETDLTTGTYNAIKKEVPIEIQQEINKNSLKIETQSAPLTTKSKPYRPIPEPTCEGCDVVAYLETQEPLDWPLCRTYTELIWNMVRNTARSSLTWVWDAMPSPILTYWYTMDMKNYPIVTDKIGAHAHGWAWHQNVDFGIPLLSTDVYHDVYVYGLWDKDPTTGTRVKISAFAQYTGETYDFLHSHLYLLWK